MTENIKSNLILIAEDDSDHYHLIKNAFHGNQLSEENLFRVINGVEVMDYLLHQGKFSNKKDYPRPAMVILDLNLPKKDGRTVLREMKSHPDLKDIPVAILTTSINNEDEINSYNLGANYFFRKPVLFKEYVEIIKTLQQCVVNSKNHTL